MVACTMTIFSPAIILLELIINLIVYRSDHKLSKELNGSISQINEIYSSYSDTPQHYEVCQTSQSTTEPEYSYTTHIVATKNMYDSVPQQSSVDDGCYVTEGLTVIDNTALYSGACEDGEYSKLSRK